MKEMLDENIITQELLSPQVLELKPEQSIKLKENLENPFSIQIAKTFLYKDINDKNRNKQQ